LKSAQAGWKPCGFVLIKYRKQKNKWVFFENMS